MKAKTRGRYFSLSLYREALAQLALPGFLLLGMLLAGTVLVSGNALAWHHLMRAGTPDPYWYSFPDISEAWALIPLFIWVAPFLLSILSFNFLTSRKKSDYYHALPLRREALFLSYLAAIVTWLFSAVLFAMLLGGGIFVAGGIGVDWASIGIIGLEFMTAMLFAVSLALLAVSLSGTLFSNIVLINIFLWLPLLASTLFRRGVISMVPTLPQSAVSFFGLDASITLFTVVRLLDFPEATTSPVNALWTLLIAFMILAAAALFFVRRKSEMAGNSAASNRMQALYRIAVSLPPLLFSFSTVGLSSVFLMSSVGFAAPLFLFEGAILTLPIALVSALILMCAFELISTKRWRNLLKAPLSFAIALALSMLFAFSIWAVATFEANFSPGSDEIEKVRIVSPHDRYGFLHSLYDDWVDPSESESERELRLALTKLIKNEVEIRDKAVIDIAVDWLSQGCTSGSGGRSLNPPPVDIFDLFFADHLNFGMEEKLIFEIHTSNGATRQRVLSYGSYSWRDSEFKINELGEALIVAGSE